jgi:AbrB family looped-hinge helix DNA binding protein
MKATGIVRRLDDLGRVVIPKEIRRQMKIREGDPLEIYTEKNGTVCFRKYSPMDAMDLDTIKKICDSGLGDYNYTVFDRYGEAIVPKLVNDDVRIDLDLPLDKNTCLIKSDGDVIGYLQSPSGNKEIISTIIGSLFKD